MSTRGFTNGPNAENESAQAPRRPKRRRYVNRPIGAFENVARTPARQGIKRQTWRHIDREGLPLTALQQVALSALSEEPAAPRVIAGRCSLSRRQVTDAVFRLSAKGLAVRSGDGWRRA